MYFKKKKISFIHKVPYNQDLDIDILESKIKPLGIEEFYNYTDKNGLNKVKLTIQPKRIKFVSKIQIESLPIKILHSVITNVSSHIFNFKSKLISIQMEASLTIPDEMESYCIVIGGWLPINYGVPNSIILADRNFISKIEKMYLDNNPKKEPQLDWVSKFSEFNFMIDVIPFALESNKKGLTNPILIKEQISEAKTKVKKAFPNISIANYKNITLEDYTCKLLAALTPQIELRQKFLLSVAEFLISSKKHNVIIERWSKIVQVADEIQIKRSDICVILALLLISAPQGKSFPLKIIKPSSTYRESDAYNAVFDINLIELLINYSDLYPAKNYVIVTSDKNLVAFGAFLTKLKYKKSQDGTRNYNTSILIEYIGGEELARVLVKLINENP